MSAQTTTTKKMTASAAVAAAVALRATAAVAARAALSAIAVAQAAERSARAAAAASSAALEEARAATLAEMEAEIDQRARNQAQLREQSEVRCEKRQRPTLEERDVHMRMTYDNFLQSLRYTQASYTGALRAYLRSCGTRKPARSQCTLEYKVTLDAAIQMKQTGVTERSIMTLPIHPWHGNFALPELPALQYRWRVMLGRRDASDYMQPQTEAQMRDGFETLRHRTEKTVGGGVILTTAELLYAGFLTLSQCEATFLEPLSDEELATRHILELRDATWESRELVVCSSKLGVPVQRSATEYFPFPLHLVNFAGERVASSMQAMLLVIARV